jgi:TATA binding protein of transcription factor TFIID
VASAVQKLYNQLKELGVLYVEEAAKRD